MRVDLLRHGATEMEGHYCGSMDVALSERGWSQSWAAVDGYSWDRIISSPSRRCAAFANALATHLAVAYTQDERLREMHFGIWEGRSASELMETDADALRRFWEDPALHPPPQSESLADLRTRAMSFMRELASGRDSERNRERVLVVTHGGPIRVVLAELSGVPLSRSIDIEVLHAARFAVDISALAECS